MQKLDEFSGEFKAIRQTLAEHSQILAKHSQILLRHDHVLSEHGQRFEFVEEQLEFIRENMVIKKEYLHDQDQIVTILKRLDEDRLFTHGRIDRVEKNVGLQMA